MRESKNDEKTSLLNAKFKLSPGYPVIAIVREEQGESSRVFLISERTNDGYVFFYERFEFDGENFNYVKKEGTYNWAYPRLTEYILEDTVVVGKSWQVESEDYSRLCALIQDQKRVHAMEAEKASQAERDLFFHRRNQEDYDEYKKMLQLQPFEWVIATLRKSAIEKYCKICTISELPGDLTVHQQNKDILFIRNKNDSGVDVYFVREDTGRYDLENPIYIDDEDEALLRFTQMVRNEGYNPTHRDMVVSHAYSCIEWKRGFVKREITLPENIDDVSDKIPDIGKDFWEQQRKYKNLEGDYYIILEELRRIKVRDQLEKVVDKLDNKLGFFSTGVRDKIYNVEQAMFKHATNIISDSAGIKSIINALNVPRKNLLTYFFWSIVLFFRKDKLTSSCEYFLIELVKHDAASLIIDNNRLYLNFENKYLNERIDVGVSSENLSRELTELCQTPRP